MQHSLRHIIELILKVENKKDFFNYKQAITKIQRYLLKMKKMIKIVELIKIITIQFMIISMILMIMKLNMNMKRY